jgi:hypothetical protein
MPRKTVVWLLLAACAPFTVAVTLAFLACAYTTTTTTTQVEKIPEPIYSYRSPTLDFTKLNGLCIMPFIPLRGTPTPWEEKMQSMLASSLPTALQAQFPGWKIYGPDEFLNYINKNNLIRGFQYLQADLAEMPLTALAGSEQQFLEFLASGKSFTREPAVPSLRFSGETLEFFKRLEKFCDSLLLIQYQIYLFTPQQVSEVTPIYWAAQVAATLFHPASGPRARWWIGLFEVNRRYAELVIGPVLGPVFRSQREVPSAKVIELIVQSLSQNLGKGSLRNI